MEKLRCLHEKIGKDHRVTKTMVCIQREILLPEQSSTDQTVSHCVWEFCHEIPCQRDLGLEARPQVSVTPGFLESTQPVISNKICLAANDTKYRPKLPSQRLTLCLAIEIVSRLLCAFCLFSHLQCSISCTPQPTTIPVKPFNRSLTMFLFRSSPSPPPPTILF